MEKILKILLFLPILALSTKAEWVVKSYQEIKNERVIDKLMSNLVVLHL